MSRLTWNNTGEKIYETGVKDVALYVVDSATGKYGNGVAWEGVVNISDKPSGAETTKLYAEDVVYANLISAEEYKASIEAYTYPDEFAVCDGSYEIAQGINIRQQDRSSFGYVYKTTIGNDTKGMNYGYKLHVVYGATAAPTEVSHDSINESPEAGTFSWEIDTVPVAVKGKKPTAKVEIDSTKVAEGVMAKLEAAFYGDESKDAKLLMPDEIITLISAG